MKIKVTFEVDTPQEAREVLSAVERLGTLPYQLNGFGSPVIKGDTPNKVGVSEEENVPPIDVKNDTPDAAKNVNPGVPLISKIGSKTKDELLKMLAKSQQPGPKFTEHMKLLWSRGEVKFDGKEYYL